MNRTDTVKVREIIERFIIERSRQYDDMPEKTKKDLRAKNAAGREIDGVIKLYRRMKIAPYKPSKLPKTVKAGTCLCGADVTVGERYSVRTDGVTTITRTCACGRRNDVDLTVLRRVQPVAWTVRTCFCGGEVRLRSDYAGSGFDGYDGPLDFVGRTRKNRTTTTTCSGCACRWTFLIRFEKVDGGSATRRTIPTQTVQRCARCRSIDLGDEWTTVERKQKRARV